MKTFIPTLTILLGILVSCKNPSVSNDQTLHSMSISEVEDNIETTDAFIPSEAFKSYWYAGEAEISSYKLEQARYGELRDGEAVLVFVTEDFLPEAQVKADQYDKANTPVLKLNAMKTFTTGIYPYSIMESTFYPVSNTAHAMKVSCSVQEWCGHVYSQLNNRSQFEISSHSYFESEGDANFKLDKAVLENELWTQLRLDPSSLPTGTLNIIPSLAYLRLKHLDTKAYEANVTHTKGQYIIDFKTLDRKLTINYAVAFPHQITSWEVSYKDGYGDNSKMLITKATLLNTIKSPYWTKKSNADLHLRDTLKLK
ncbi:septum formation inhibitor Maf [Psychroserpens algicola]|uniref:septum formation inhibitor Maf n=1 Tax=Psychroserpens algicola TaxID=1719034 RepID=UPI001952C27E|nr:septum formation inhibitor Maf [Psychroserpens algicola]